MTKLPTFKTVSAVVFAGALFAISTGLFALGGGIQWTVPAVGYTVAAAGTIDTAR